MTIYSTATLLVALTLLPSTTLAALHIPLARRQNAHVHTVDDWAIMADNMRIRYGRLPVAPTLAEKRKRQNTADIPMTNQNSDSSYFAEIDIGTP